MKTFHILVAAVPRYDLHKSCFIELVKLLENDFNVKLYINFDVPRMVSDKVNEIDDTINECKKLNIEVIHSVNDTNPCFSRAFFKLFYLAEQNIKSQWGNDDIFMWLEDDWKLIESKTFLNSINLLESKDAVTLVNPIPSGPPFMFNKRFFFMIKSFVNTFNNESPKYGLDPERVMQHTYMENKNVVSTERVGDRDDIQFQKDAWSKSL
jgi:hypothetical protein